MVCSVPITGLISSNCGRAIGQAPARRFEIPDGQLAVRQYFDDVQDHGRIENLLPAFIIVRLTITHPGIFLILYKK
jgi:hypothetical protein